MRSGLLLRSGFFVQVRLMPSCSIGVQRLAGTKRDQKEQNVKSIRKSGKVSHPERISFSLMWT